MTPPAQYRPVAGRSAPWRHMVIASRYGNHLWIALKKCGA
jgi:hypothetical protein